MYCPKCGDVMEEKGETFLCVRGNMPLSPRTARQLYASFVNKSQEPEDFTFEIRQKCGGNWFSTNSLRYFPIFRRHFELHPHA
jgi:hypothetical protein